MPKKITKGQKKIILAAFATIGVSWAFWFFIYLPACNDLRRIREEWLKAQGQIQDIEAVIIQARTTAEGIKLLKERYRLIDNKFSLRPEGSLKMLSDLARRLNIEIASVGPKPAIVFAGRDNQRTIIDGKTCQVIPVSMELKCFYKDLVRYIGMLEQNPAAFVTVERISIKKASPGAARLGVTLELGLYYLS